MWWGCDRSIFLNLTRRGRKLFDGEIPISCVLPSTLSTSSFATNHTKETPCPISRNDQQVKKILALR
jgi:hypothetical protein